MHRKLSVLASSLVAILLALVVPATSVAAYPYTATVQVNKCAATGGTYGYGFIRFEVLQKEWGKSGTNYFNATVKVQRRHIGTTSWHLVRSSPWNSESFPNDSHSYSWTVGDTYDLTAADSMSYEFRIVAKLRWWKGQPGSAVRLALITKRSRVC
jgi:hypothetical protein